MQFFKKNNQDPASVAKQVDTSINVSSVTIPKYRVKGNFVEYVIECTRISNTWQIYRRYQQFKSLDAQLRALCPMGSPNHCEFGVVPALSGSSWTEVTNQSPELVERRRRYLEIYLQQLLVPKNLFYAAKTALFAFLHDGEVSVQNKTRLNKPLLGLGTVVDSGAEAEIDDHHDGMNPKQVVAVNRSNLIYPDSVIAASIPDYSATSTSRMPAEGGQDDEPVPAPNLGVYRERCLNCGHETEVDYEINEWTPEGRCPMCKVHAMHALVKPDGSVASPEELEQETALGESSDMWPRSNRPYNVVPKAGSRTDLSATPTPPRAQADAANEEEQDGDDAKDSPKTAAEAGDPEENGSDAATSSTMPTAVQPNDDEEDTGEIDLGDDHIVRTNVAITDFTLITTLGRGTFGKVMKVKFNEDNKVYAMKVLSKNVIYKRRMIDYIKEEKAIMSFVPPHPFVVTLHFAFQNDHHIYLVLDYLPGGELYTHIYPNRNLREADARFYTAEVVLAVEHMHRHDVVHRDIKPENIVLDGEGHLKLTDFGLARMNFSQGRRRSFVGSAEYLAPETIQGDVQTKALDWWSVGVMLYEMLCGVAPFHANNNNDVYQAVLHKKLDLNKPCFSAHAQSLIARLLDKDPRQRLTDPVKIKAHPFFASINWAALMDRKLRPPFVPDLGENDTKYFSRDFTAEWATITKPGGCGRQTLDMLTRRFSNFHYVDENRINASESSAPKAVVAEHKDPSSVSSSLANKGEVMMGTSPSQVPALINPDSFVGTWRLVKLEMVAVDGKVAYPWGSEVIGMLVYCSNGMFSMQMCPMRRHKFRNPMQGRITRDEMADAYLTYVSMFGTYEVTPGKNYITHHSNGALCPNMVTAKERRYFELRGEKHLVLSTSNMETDEGIVAKTSITWERVQDNLSAST